MMVEITKLVRMWRLTSREKQLHGVRCLVTELWETITDVPYAKLKPLLKKEVDSNVLSMLTTGIRIQDLMFLDCVQPEELLTREADTDAIIDSGSSYVYAHDSAG